MSSKQTNLNNSQEKIINVRKGVGDEDTKNFFFSHDLTRKKGKFKLKKGILCLTHKNFFISFSFHLCLKNKFHEF
jgi:hypothetical protein